MEDRILSNRYTLESEIGRGGMGVVYKATDTEVKRTVAVKTLPAVLSHNQDLMRRFTSEVQHASKLEHPNIVRVYDVGEDDGTHFSRLQRGCCASIDQMGQLDRYEWCCRLVETLPPWRSECQIAS